MVSQQKLATLLRITLGKEQDHSHRKNVSGMHIGALLQIQVQQITKNLQILEFTETEDSTRDYQQLYDLIFLLYTIIVRLILLSFVPVDEEANK